MYSSDGRSLLGVTEQYQEAVSLTEPFKRVGIFPYIEHASLRVGDELRGAYAVYLNPDDATRVLMDSELSKLVKP